MSDLYRLVYTSRNLLPGPEQAMAAAVVDILSASQRNNAAVDVTGALMFNGRAFAQVLEGPLRAVEATFERIQRDERHGDVTVLQCGSVEARGFENWSMAFVGQSSRGQSLWKELAGESGFDASRLDGDAVFAMLQGLLIEEEGGQTMSDGPAATPPPSVPARDSLGGEQFPADRIRSELAKVGPVDSASTPSGPEEALKPLIHAAADHTRADANGTEGTLDVMRTALRAERRLTNELKEQVDDLRIRLVTAAEEMRLLRAERDKWMSRAGALASLISNEAQGAPSDERTQAHGASIAADRAAA